MEFDDQPASTMPYTPSEAMANTNNTPMFTLAMTIGTPRRVLPKGTTAIVSIAGAMARHGASQ